MFYHRQVMCDKEIGQVFLLLKFDQQVDNLCLNGNVKS